MSNQMEQGRLVALAAQLRAQGIDPGTLGSLQEELDVIETPPSLIRRIREKAGQVAAQQWRHVMGEVQESKEVMEILRRSVRDKVKPTEDERALVRAQMMDLMKVVPAGLIAVGNSALPLPGTGIFTPWLLKKMGLMPSRWREAHVLDRLQKEATRLRAEGHSEEAHAIDVERERIEHEADERSRCETQAALLTHWDANENGRWDDDEVAAYAVAVGELTRLAGDMASRKRWFLIQEGQVFGPVRLRRFLEGGETPGLLVCYAELSRSRAC